MQAQKIPPSGKIHTIKSLAESEPAFTAQGLRSFIRKHQTDLEDLGVIWYTGNKTQIDRDEFIAYMQIRSRAARAVRA